MLSKTLISGVIITKNEEGNIGRCLDSLKDIADEIVVVDSYSTDQTEAICSRYDRLKFVSAEWQGYSKTKNYANSLARGTHILSLDADEILSPELAESLKQQFEEDPFPEACSFNRLTSLSGKWVRHCGWYPDRKVRLWKNGIAHWQGNIHESLQFKGKVTVRQLKGDLLHNSYPSYETLYEQTIKYAELRAKENYRRGKRGHLLTIMFSPLFSFISSYLFKLGFLDGRSGWIIGTSKARGTYHKYLKTRQYFKNGGYSTDIFQ